MSDSIKRLLRQCAKGCWQEEIIEKFIEYSTITNPVYWLKGEAKNYSGRYTQSFNVLLDRIKSNGFDVKRIPGKCGGWYSSTFTLETKEECIRNII
jgi:hypothetical protein